MTQPQHTSTREAFLDRLRRLALLGMFVVATACGSIEPGEADLGPIRRLPDARRFGLEVHPLLTSNCSAASCHGGPGTFRLEPAEVALLPDQQIDHPQDLPEPFRTGYYTVLDLCDLNFPEASQLLRWGTGDRPEHPGGQALGPAEAAQIVTWLRSGGAAE